jgi:predicted transcriptional regulator
MRRRDTRSYDAPGEARELPELELACLRILWVNGDLNVHDVRRLLQPRRELAYTTVMTVLDRLTRKGVASRQKIGRVHIYHAEMPRDNARERAVERLLDIYFDGSRASLAAFLRSPASLPEHAPIKAAAASADKSFDDSLL